MSITADRPLSGSSDLPPLSTATPTYPGPDGPGSVLIRLIRRVHFYAGVLVAPFLVILCLTGIAYVFTPQINDVLYARELIVAPQPVEPRSLDAQVAVAMAAFPDAVLDSVQPAVQPDRATAVLLDPPGAAGDDKLAVYVDPYTAEITGTLTSNHGEPPVQHWLRNFHGDLQLGTIGAIYSELAASWLPVLFVGGLVLWIRKRRARRRDLVLPSSSIRPGRARMLSWHGSVGIWLTVALVFISLTGLTWSTSTIGILAHTGTLLGLSNQIALSAMSLGILAVIFWGYRMWWLRRPTRGGAPRPLELRGVLRSSPQPMLLGILAAAVALGWLLPVFGDVLAGAFVRRRPV